MQRRDLAEIYLCALRDFAGFARDNAFHAIEMSMISPIHAGVLSEVEKQIGAAIGGFNTVTCHLPTGEINISALHRALRREAIEETKRSIDFCHRLGIGQVVMHPGCFAAMPDMYALVRDRTRAIAQESILEIHDHCREMGIALSVENLHRDEPLFQKPDEFESIVDRGVGVALDTVHAFESGVDPIDFVKTYGSSVTEVHLTDGIKSDAVKHYPIGKGEVDCAAVLDELGRTGFEGPIVVEVDSKEDLVQSMAFLRDRGYL